MFTTIVYGIAFGFAILLYALITVNLTNILPLLDIFLIISWLAILGSPWIAAYCGISSMPFVIGLCYIFAPAIILFLVALVTNWH